MRLIAALLVAAGAVSNERWFSDEDVAVEQAISYDEFEKTFYSKARSHICAGWKVAAWARAEPVLSTS